MSSNAFTPTITEGKEYNLKLVAVVIDSHGKSTNIYSYVDDDGDTMLVRDFNKNCLLPYVKGKLCLRKNTRTKRQYTVLEVIGRGFKEDHKEIALPSSYTEGRVYQGEKLINIIKDAAEKALDEIQYVEEDWEGDCEAYVDRKLGSKPSSSTKENWYDRAYARMEEACEPFMTEEKEEIEAIVDELVNKA